MMTNSHEKARDVDLDLAPVDEVVNICDDFACEWKASWWLFNEFEAGREETALFVARTCGKGGAEEAHICVRLSG